LSLASHGLSSTFNVHKVKLQGEGIPRIRGLLGQAGSQAQAHILEMSLPVGFTHCSTAQGAEPYHELKHM